MRTNDLFARQRVLTEIGDRGQARLNEAVYSPSAHLTPQARQFSVRYARACGFCDVGPETVTAPHPSAHFFRHAAATDIGLAALDVLSQALQHFELTSPPA